VVRARVAMGNRREEVRIGLVKLPLMQASVRRRDEVEDGQFKWRVAIRYGYLRLAWAFTRTRWFRFASGPFILALKLLLLQNVGRCTNFECPWLRTIHDESQPQEIFIPRQDTARQRDMACGEVQLRSGCRQSHAV